MNECFGAAVANIQVKFGCDLNLDVVAQAGKSSVASAEIYGWTAWLEPQFHMTETKHPTWLRRAMQQTVVLHLITFENSRCC
jgi:nicotinamide riboside transporter PnuC